MYLICEHCGKPVDKYKAFAFDADWLENYLVDYFQQKTNSYLSRRYSAGHRMQPNVGISYYMIKKYALLKQNQIADRYKRTETSVSALIRTVDEKNVDVIFLDKELSGELDFSRYKENHHVG